MSEEIKQPETSEQTSTFDDLRKMIQNQQIKVQDSIQVLIVLAMVFGSDWFWIHIPLLALLLGAFRLVQVQNIFPKHLPQRWWLYPICAILLIKFVLAFNPVSKFWIYHIVGHLSSVGLVILVWKMVYSLSPCFETSRDPSLQKKLSQILPEAKDQTKT